MFNKEHLINLNNNDPYNIPILFGKESKEFNFINGASKFWSVGKFLKNYTAGFLINNHTLYFDTIGYESPNTAEHNRSKTVLYIKIDGIEGKLPTLLPNSFRIYCQIKFTTSDNISKYWIINTDMIYREDYSYYYPSVFAESLDYTTLKQFHNKETMMTIEIFKIDNVNINAIPYII